MLSRDPIKIAVAVALSIYFLWCAYDPANAWFMHNINLAIHETGHLVFRPFGEFLMVAGGSLFQIIVPIVFCGYFARRGEWFSAACVLLWVGQSATDVYVYAADAQKMQLVLTGGLTGSEGGFHDWNYLLEATGLLARTNAIANLIRFIGNITIFAGIVGMFLYAEPSESYEG